MSKTYDLRFRGKLYNGISLAKARQILSQTYSYDYIQDLVSKADGDYAPVTIGWTPGRRMNWIIDGIHMGYRAAHFALTFKGHTDEEAACLLRCGRLLAEIESELQC